MDDSVCHGYDGSNQKLTSSSVYPPLSRWKIRIVKTRLREEVENDMGNALTSLGKFRAELAPNHSGARYMRAI